MKTVTTEVSARPRAAVVRIFSGERNASPSIDIAVADLPNGNVAHRIAVERAVEIAARFLPGNESWQDMFPEGIHSGLKMIILPQGEASDATKEWRIGGCHKAGGWT